VDPFTGTGLSAESQLSLFERGAPGFGAPPPPEWPDPQCGDPAFGTPLEAFYPSYTADAATVGFALANDEEYLSPNPFTGAPGTGPAPNTPAIECARATGFNDDTMIQSDTEQLSIFVAGEHKFSDALTAKVELNIVRQRFNDRAIWGDEGGRRWIPDRPEFLGLPFSFPSARVDPTSVSHPGLAYAQFLDPTFGLNPGAPAIPGMAGCPPGAPCGPPFFRGTPPTPAVPAGYNPLYQRGETLPFRGETDANMETDLWRTAFTLEGEINADWRWKLDATAAYNTVRQNTRDTILENYALALNGLGGADCNPANLNDPRDPLNDPSRGVVVPGESQCYWYNPLMNNALPDAATNSAYMVGTAVSSTGLANDAVMLDWLTPLRLDIYDAEFYSYDFQVSGFFGSLPGGPVGLAAGAGVRSDTVTRDSDRLVNAGLTAAIGTFNDFSGRQKVNNVYAELALPIHDDVNIQVAARYEDYVDGFSETSPKIAVLWTPTDDLTLRASWGQSFKAPSTIHTQAETFVGGGGRERVTINGVEYGGRGGILGTLRIEPNAALQAQTSDNWSVGFDWNVSDNITVGATYIGIEFTDRVANPTFPSTVRSLSCLYTDANGLPITDSVLPDGSVDPEGFMQWNVYGDPSLGAPLETTGGNKGCMIPSAVGADPFVPIGAGLVGLAVSTPANLGYLNVEALDIRANMFWDTPIGQVSFVPNLSIYTKYEFPRSQLSNADFLCPPSGDPETTTDDVCDGVGRDIGFPETAIQSLPRWSGTFTGGLRFGSQNVRLTARFTDGINIAYGDLTDTQEARFQHDEGLWTLDLNYSWQMSAASGLNLSVRNLFAEEPQANIGRGFFNRNRRTYSVQYTHSFAN